MRRLDYVIYSVGRVCSFWSRLEWDLVTEVRTLMIVFKSSSSDLWQQILITTPSCTHSCGLSVSHSRLVFFLTRQKGRDADVMIRNHHHPSWWCTINFNFTYVRTWALTAAVTIGMHIHFFVIACTLSVVVTITSCRMPCNTCEMISSGHHDGVPNHHSTQLQHYVHIPCNLLISIQ